MTNERIAEIRKLAGHYRSARPILLECLDEIERLTRRLDLAVAIKEVQKHILLQKIEKHAKAERELTRLRATIQDMKEDAESQSFERDLNT